MFAQPEIWQFDVTSGIKQNIIRLEISMNVFDFVDWVQC